MKKITLLFTILPILAFAQVTNGTFDGNITDWSAQGPGSEPAPTLSYDGTEDHTANTFGSLKLDVGATAKTGAKLPNGTLNNGSGDYVYSAWIKGTSGNVVRLDLFELGINVFSSSPQITLATSDWELIQHTFTGLDFANLVSLRIINRTPSSSILIDDVSFVGGVGLSTSKIDNNAIDIYPNPAKNELNISKAVKINKVSIYEITGKLVIEELNLTHNKIDVSKLNSGIYLLRVQDENDNISTKRFIKE